MNNHTYRNIALSYSRTYLAQIRTAAIFVGISALVIKSKYPFIARLILIAVSLLTALGTYSYYHINNIEQHNSAILTYYPIDYYIHLSYSFILLVVMLLLIMYTFMPIKIIK